MSLIGALSVVVDNLKKDLTALTHQIRVDGGDIIISHTGSALSVIAPLKYKAMIPKKYHSFDVRFMEWKELPEPAEELSIDYNTQYDLDYHQTIYGDETWTKIAADLRKINCHVCYDSFL